jgi:hypothetical protein
MGVFIKMVNRVLDKNRYVFLEKPAMQVLHKEENELRSLEIKGYLEKLKEFNITLSSLTKIQYDKKDRSLMLNLAMILLSEKKLWERTLEDKHIPLKHFSRIVEEPVFELKEWQNQILAYALLLEEEKYPLIGKYLHYGANDKEDSFLRDANINMGLSLLTKGRSSYILTSQGQFLKISTEDIPSGHMASGKIQRQKRHIVTPLIVVLVSAALLAGLYVNLSRRVSQTIILKAVGEVKMDFNPWGDVVEVIGINAAGRNFVEGAEFEDTDADTVLAEIIEQAYIKEIIREKEEITVLVSGAFLPEDFFKSGKTRDRILSYQLNAKINNNGSFLFVD